MNAEEEKLVEQIVDQYLKANPSTVEFLKQVKPEHWKFFEDPGMIQFISAILIRIMKRVRAE